MPVSSEYTVIVGKERFRLMTGDILVINSGVVHSLLAPPTGERIIFQFDPSLLYLLKELETLMSLMPGVVHITPETEPELYGPVKTQMNRIIREYDEEKMFCGAVVYAALIEMFVEIGRTVTMRKVRGDATQRRPLSGSGDESLRLYQFPLSGKIKAGRCGSHCGIFQVPFYQSI